MNMVLLGGIEVIIGIDVMDFFGDGGFGGFMGEVSVGG